LRRFPTSRDRHRLLFCPSSVGLFAL